MTYERDQYMRQQEAEHDMIRMRTPVAVGERRNKIPAQGGGGPEVDGGQTEALVATQAPRAKPQRQRHEPQGVAPGETGLSRHTAGPWMVEPINSGLTYQVTTTEQAGFRVICETPWCDDDDAANAQLIAAAPTMASAIDEYLAARAGYEVSPTHNGPVCDAAAKRYADALAGLSTALAAGISA